MTKQKKLNKVSCSDWHLGWGYIYTAIGTLEKVNENTFKYKGKNQGRHGQRYGLGSCTIIVEKIISDNDIEYTIEDKKGKFSLPCFSELIKSINILNQ